MSVACGVARNRKRHALPLTVLRSARAFSYVSLNSNTRGSGVSPQVAHQQFEKLVLARRQTQRISAPRHTMTRRVEQIAASQEQMARTVGQLTTGQEQLTREITKLQAAEQDILNKISVPPPQPVASPSRKQAFPAR